MYNGIQTSKVTLDTICMQNTQTYKYASRTKNIGKSYSIDHFGNMHEQYFDKDPWQYKINKYGFRGADWNFRPSIAVFGCSNIFGIGVKKSVADLISELIDQPVHNLGVPGASSTNIIKTFVSFANLHPMTDAVISLPSIQRVFHPSLHPRKLDAWHWDNMIHWTGQDNIKLIKAIDRVWKDDVSISHVADLIDWAESVAATKGIKIHWTSWAPLNVSSSHNSINFHVKDMCNNYFSWPDIRTDVARDGKHPGPAVIKNLALNIIEAIGRSI